VNGAQKMQVPTALGRLSTTLRQGSGDRLPLVLGHGIYMDSGLWDAVLPAFEDRTVVTVDGPGHGNSDDPPAGWTLDQHVGALLEVMDHHRLDRAVLAGHSWGGMVSLRLTLAHPHRVAGLGLVNTPLTRPEGLSRAGFRAQQAMLVTAGPVRFYGRKAAASMYDAASLEHHPALATAMADRLASRRGRVLAQTLASVILEPVDMLEQLHGVQVPVCVVVGATDYVLPPATRRAVAAELPHASITVTTGAHVSPQEDPETTTKALHDLLERAETT
jgi:3-oxoadipate enol-lactonase